MAVANYHDANGHYPPAYLAGDDGRPAHSWRVLILPYIEGSHVFRRYSFKEPWDGPGNRELAGLMPRVLALPGEYQPGSTTTNYVVVVGPETAFPPGGFISRESITDEPGQTVLVTENLGAGIHWMEPRDLLFSGMDFTINSPRGVSSSFAYPAAVMCDGSVRRLGQGVSPGTLRALLTVRGGERLAEGEGGWEVIPDGRDRPPADG